ncbi:MAG TPA: hypothetical protein VLX90_17455 [Steroidobacteraceae bacterium]|nr:hypothetical protein [Steroidobacteraceae bacterium]
MSYEAGLEVDYVPLSGDEPARWDGVLGVARFAGAAPAPLTARGVPVVNVGTPVLGSPDEICEVWRTRQPVRSGQLAGVRYRHAGHVLFGCISVHEDDAGSMPIPAGAGSALHAATEQAYRQVFATLDELDYPHLLRVWNYLPRINADTHGTERYWQFNSARRDALLACGRDLSGGNVPAACALGSSSDSPLVIYFLASRELPLAIENPRQVSAYEYPPRYGPRPAFSRASLLRETAGPVLFISGTASIVGHETLHAGDVAAQTRETLVNIEALLNEAGRVCGDASFGLEDLAYKVYVRHGTDLPVIRTQLRSALGPQAQIMYLQADICRQDLLLEIEATGRGSAHAES